MNGKILLVNGPNLNMLGIREPEKYGNQKLMEIVEEIDKIAEQNGFKLVSLQSNCEGDLVDFIQKEGINGKGLIINAGAYTHTSIAIRDAILSVKIPSIEVHLSNIFAREDFRHHSYLSDIAIGVICGFGPNSYYLAIKAMIDFIAKSR